MKNFYAPKNIFFFLLLFINLPFIFPQMNDNFIQGVLEEGNNYLLDVTDYHNMFIIISSSKIIYTGIPPVQKIETTAKLIKVSSLITINENYLLASCLEDSFLGKINLSTGVFVSLLSYSDLDSSETLEIPKAICSLSNIDNIVFIAYSKIEDISDEKMITKLLFKINIINKESTEEGPAIDTSKEFDDFTIAQEKMDSPSLRQISCEPVRIHDNINDYRLICMHESISKFYFDTFTSISSDIFAFSINSNFDDYDTGIRGHKIASDTRYLGFRIYRENDAYAKCVTGNSLVEMYLDTDGTVKDTSFSSSSYNLFADLDLIAYNNEFTFSAQKISYMGLDNIYSLQINQKDYSNYFRFIDYKVNTIEKILGYYNQASNKILFLYQTDNSIKYFILDNIVNFYTLGSFTHQINVKSYEENVQYDLRELITSPNLEDLGYLNVEMIKYKINTYSNSYEYFGTDFNQILMSNNILIPEPSLNDWKTYNLSFIDHIKDEYTRIYHLTSLTIKIQTCKSGCYSCWEDYNTCTDCDNDANYAPLEDRSDECFPPWYIVDGYIYDINSNKFLTCYENCEFCTEAYGSSSDQKCSSCPPGYLYSYINLGNCYLYTNLALSDDKSVDNVNEIFIASTCNKYKIASTGECVEECPLSSPYYLYEFNEDSQLNEKKYLDPPKYLFNNMCYEQCPENSLPNEDNNNCECENYYYIDNNGIINCLSGENCPGEYPYLNQDTKECFNSLDNCDYFFGDICYNNCPSDKMQLSSQNENIKNYFKEKLSLSNTLLNKMCICDIINGVWSNINLNEEQEYFQECLSSCPSGYDPEEITNHCIRQNSPDSTISNNIFSTNKEENINTNTYKNIFSTNKEENINTNTYIKTTNNEIKPTSTQSINDDGDTIINSTEEPSHTQLITDEIKIIPPEEPNPLCPNKNKFEGKCYPHCPEGTCLTKDDPGLNLCIRITPNTQVFNGICFENFSEITQNIKSLSESGEIISTNSGIIIHAYSSNPKEEKNKEKNANYSLVYLHDCEYKIKSYYNISNDTKLYILGIDSPNKDIKSSVNVYNFGIYLEDGTLLPHSEICKNTKIEISSPISNTDLIKLEEAIYFSNLGYDIYDENSLFYNDICSAASINGNDIILSDRKKDFFPEGVSLCNDSCTYSQVDLETKRFSCSCDLNYNFSEKIINDKNNNNGNNNEDDASYMEYFLSLINYKIIKCYKLFFEYKSYY